MARKTRVRAASTNEVRVRLRSAEAYLEVADLVLEERARVEMPGVAAGLAVLAGIAASDAICARRLGQIHRGEDHGAAGDLLKQATPDGGKLAATFRLLIDMRRARSRRRRPTGTRTYPSSRCSHGRVAP